jgi:hypothetical protein
MARRYCVWSEGVEGNLTAMSTLLNGHMHHLGAFRYCPGMFSTIPDNASYVASK